MEDRERQIQKFKEFLLKNPHLIHYVRKENKTWQEMFEEWYLFGDDDSRWYTEYEGKKEKNKQSNDWIQSVKGRLQSLDEQQIEQYLAQFKDALEMISSLLTQFKPTNDQPNRPNNETKNESYMTYWR
ncbi:hypothetical protein KP78_23100 [Jeotgalibacillus soli]|uniref:Cytosolic protein n=2 Tax=Jeotgalibacillus soli TaxID=889306 RepID=A0A0C2VJW0_9BACL|nr:hypothetical protein KP78_23100 [Jeotgalibacillus soli]